MVTATASFTRPNDTTAYATNDLIANSTTAGSVTPMIFDFPIGFGGKLKINSVKVQKSGTTATNSNFHIRLYGSSPTVANGDNGAWSTNIAGYLGKIDPVILEAFTDGCTVFDGLGETTDVHFIGGATNTMYGLLVADAAYTPAAEEVFTITLFADVTR